MDKGELPLEGSDENMSSEVAAPPEEGAPALEGASTLQEVVSTSASDPGTVFASWSRMTAGAVKMESVQSQETCGKLISKNYFWFRWENKFNCY